MNLEQGKIVKWTSHEGKEIVWMITDRKNIGIVIHSDNLVKLGTLNDLTTYNVEPFVGTINVNSN